MSSLIIQNLIKKKYIFQNVKKWEINILKKNYVTILNNKNNFLKKNFQCSIKNKIFINNNFHWNLFQNFSSSKEEFIKVINVPTMGDSITEGTVQKWNKGVGDYVKTDEPIATIETDKISVEIRAPSSGVIKEIFVKEGDSVQVGAQLYVLDTSQSQPEKSKISKESQTTSKEIPKESQTTSKEIPKESQTIAKESQKSKQSPIETKPQQLFEIQASTTIKPIETGIREHREKMSRMRERIATRLKDSQNTYAMLTTFNEIDMFNITNLRNNYKDEFQEKHGVKLGFMSIFVKAAVIALQEIPVVNAVIDGNEIVYRDYIDISVAVATPTGLVVPVLRNCDKMSFADIEKQITNLGKKAREGAITIEDMAGGTFTISNGGNKIYRKNFFK
jgi:2-oxoglutarate dehydrogenase E2 component (dihydrolipoamide succinyltransferase)